MGSISHLPMQRLGCILFFLVLLGMPRPLCGAESPVVTLATLEWAPYIGATLPNQGVVASLVREAYKAAGYSVDLTFMPWARVVAMARKGRYDGYVPEYFTEALAVDFFFSKPFPGGPLGFFKRKADPISFTTLADLKPYKIGVVRGYINTVDFDNADYLQKEAATDDITNLRKLVGKRVDLVVADRFVGTYLLRQFMPDRMEEVEFLLPAMEEKKLYLCISKKAPDAAQKIRAFNVGLQMITDNGILADILEAGRL